jgi:hypothetical protein
MKTAKILLIVISISLLLAFGITSYAEETEEVKAFTVTDSEGNVVAEGDTDTELRTAFAALKDGETVTLNKDIEISSRLYTEASEDSPKTVNLDLAGNMIYCFEKIGTAMVSVGKYTTVNVYSSEEGGSIYVTKKDQPDKGSNIFSVLDESSVLNVGDMTVGENFYPGSNMSTYGACLIDLMASNPGDENSAININGGTYFSIQSDYSGFIIPRCGSTTINIKNADIILHETRAPINSEGGDTVLNLENVKLIQYSGNSVALFGSFAGTVNMKNCVTTCAIKANNATSGTLNLIGKNVFTTGAGFDTAILKTFTNPVTVCTDDKYELFSGGLEYTYFDKSGDLLNVVGRLKPLTDSCRIEESANTQKYNFISGDQKLSQVWSLDEEPIKPFGLPTDKQPGVYKNAWNKSIEEDGSITYKAGKVADWAIKVNLGYDFGLYFKIYVAADLIDEGYLEHSDVMIDGGSYLRTEWREAEIDGEAYYYATTGTLEELDFEREIQVYLPCDYGNGIHVETTWIISVEEYFERVLATEADETYTAEQYELIYELKETYFPETEETLPEGGADNGEIEGGKTEDEEGEDTDSDADPEGEPDPEVE